MHSGTTEEEDEVIRNWRPPQKTKYHSAEEDHSAHAGKHERAVLTELGFVMKLEGGDIKVGHGMDEKGFLDSKVLQLWGVKSYTHLWGNEGKVVEKAREMSRGNPRVKLEKCVEELDKALSRRKKGMKEHAASRKCRGTCQKVVCGECQRAPRPRWNCLKCKSCRDCALKELHEHVEKLIRESKDTIQGLVAQCRLAPAGLA